jgi:nucleoside-diphosphate-sugar epimerase
LVIGGASFIGSQLVERLVGLGATVSVADDLSSGRSENLTAVERDVEFSKGDLKDRSFADRAVKGRDVVFHLAACHGGRGYIDTHPVECSTNMILDGTIFAAAAAAGVERVCFASSACVYPVNLQVKSTNGKAVNLKEEWADPFCSQCGRIRRRIWMG